MRKRQVVIRRSSEEAPSTRSSSTANHNNNSNNSSSVASYTVSTVRYGECQKNHAANVGGYAVDGCREFMASNGEEGTTAALTCAACGCHRNFHRREFDTEVVCDNVG